MSKFKSDNNLLNGNGEWNEEEHPRDEQGRFTYKRNSNLIKKNNYLYVDNYGINDIINLGEFVPAKSISQAEEYAQNKLGVKICSYKGIELDVANDLNAAVQKGIILCPKIKENMNFIGSLNVLNNLYEKDLIEFYMQKFQSSIYQLGENRCFEMAKHFAKKLIINIENKTYAQAIGKIRQYDDRTKIFNKYAGISINEYWGNDINKMLGKLKKNVENCWHPKGCDKISAVFDHEIGHHLDYVLNLSTNKKIVNLFDSISEFNKTINLSKYSNTSIKEFIAEGWAEYNNNPCPRDIARKIGNIIKYELES